MHFAAACNHLEIVELLIEKGAHIDAINFVSNKMISNKTSAHFHSVLYGSANLYYHVLLNDKIRDNAFCVMLYEILMILSIF